MFTIEEKVVRFRWTNLELTEEIINRSAAHAANIESVVFEQCVLTEENSIYINSEIKIAVSDLIILFIKHTNIVDGSILTSVEKDGLLQSGFAIKPICDNDGNIVVNPSRLTIIDMKCQQYIIDSVLLQWAKINNIKPFIDKLDQQQFNTLNDIKTILFHMRVLSYAKSYTFTTET